MPARLGLGRLPAPLREERAKPLVKRFSKLFRTADAHLVRSGRRSIGGWVAGDVPVLLLTTTGCRSGKPHTTPLLYHRDDDGSLVLIAANGTADWDPDWLHNLRAEPRATVTIDGSDQDVTAELLDDDLRSGFLGTMREAFPGFNAAQDACRRTIPIIRLTAVGELSGGRC
jgi:deazaflavin-dependent oxidoreductase (nitroreductase family)